MLFSDIRKLCYCVSPIQIADPSLSDKTTWYDIVNSLQTTNTFLKRVFIVQ